MNTNVKQYVRRKEYEEKDGFSIFNSGTWCVSMWHGSSGGGSNRGCCGDRSHGRDRSCGGNGSNGGRRGDGSCRRDRSHGRDGSRRTDKENGKGKPGHKEAEEC